MYKLLNASNQGAVSEPRTLLLAYSTSRVAFDFLAGRELRGLVWTASSANPDLGSVHYDLDPSYPHECMAITLTNELTKQLQAYGEHCLSCHLLFEAHTDQVLP
eukprot:GHVO01061965.1.p1 GENE.GHVO01061965.1~~GHVO01061965.1.p1  ORF type:complete len:104 (+),score=6.90 GHVO01061965.1:341-652(+)